jgi:adenine-specific DNA-methyltransferase
VLLPREDTSAYTNPDNDPKGSWKPDPVYANNPYGADYTIKKPNGVELRRPQGQYWRFSESAFLAKAENNEVIWGQGNAYPMIKRYLGEVQEGLVPVTLFSRTFAGDNSLANSQLDGLFAQGRPVSYPKPSRLITRVCQVSTRNDEAAIVLDFFAGSGTTGQAVVDLNREDGGNRKYILVEMGEYFDTVLKPRIQKVIYSKDWKDGKPVSREGSSQVFKYIRLESYEDALNNLEDARPDAIQAALEQHAGLREAYLLRYMLELDTKGSPSLLDLRGLETPFEYRLRVARGGETAEETVDLVETFNWLLGLWVRRMRAVDGFRTVEGVNPEGERVLVIWRNLREERHGNAALERFFLAQGYGERWRTLLIEEEFQRLMFAAPGEGGL